MKGIIKLFPAALAVFALASCSNEDFFGSENASGKLQLEATVEAPNPDDGTTRAAFLFTANGNSSLWESGDEFRVYDAALQKYDNFVCNGSVIAVDGTPVVAEHSKAIFPGKQVYYAGYDKDNDDVIAIMDVPAKVEFGGLDKAADGTAYYKSDMPMWGDVTDATSSNLKVELKTLSAFTDITVYQKSVKYIRVLAAKEGVTDATVVVPAAGSDPAITLAGASIAQILKNEDILDTTTPLAGYFEAQLKTGGVLKANTKNPVVKDSYKSYIEVNLKDNAADEAHIYIPIIADVEYKNLIIQTSVDGTTWTTLNQPYKKAKFKRNGALRKGLVRGNAPITAVVSSLKDLNDKLITICKAENGYTGRTVNITATGDIKTTTALKTLTIPTMSADQVVNFNFPIDDTDNPLTITGGTADHTMTINLNQGISGNTSVIINTTCDLVLTGSIESSREGSYNDLTISGNNVQLGSSADFKSFSTNMDVKSSKNLIIDAAEGEIANVELADGATLIVESGKVTKVTSASATEISTENKNTIEIAGGEVTTIENTAAGGNVKIGAAKVGTLEAKTAASTFKTTINGGEVTNLKLAKSSGDVTINNATVTTLETAATGENAVKITSTDANATVTTLKLGGAAPTVTLTGGTAADKGLAKIENLQTTDADNKQEVTLKSYDKAAVGNVTFAKAGDKVKANSYIKGAAKAADIKTDYIGTAGEIYTVAQLAGVTTGKDYKLMASINANNKEWTPVNLKGTFDGNNKTIFKITVSSTNGGLFGTISGGEVKNLTIDQITVAKAKTGDMGALAGAATGTVAVTKVAITGATIGDVTPANVDAKNINYGGLFGTTNGTITLTDNKVTGTINAYGNMGGFIGNVKGGSVTIKTSAATDATTYQSTITFALPTAPNAANAGTIGNFIGTISGNGVSVSIGGTGEGKGGNIATFFAIDGSATPQKGIDSHNYNTTLKYETRESGSKVFKGMYKPIKSQTLSREIGYCSATSLGTIYLYNTIKDNLGNIYEITLDNINVFE